MAKDRIPTSRIARTARVAGLAAGQGARQLGTRAANLTRGDRAREEALERRHLEAAEQIVTALGTMKGAAMKMGQVLSFLDVGLVPEEYRDEFQRKLGELRDAAPKVRFSDMRKVIEAELEAPLDEIFDAFDETPIAAASIGQVYRATLPDGRDVAVKVQYPGVAQAVRADMQNLGLILRLLKQIAPGLDARATAEEVRSRIGEELDYELEAQNQRRIGRLLRGHPFVRVPRVDTSLSTRRVLVSEYVEGERFEEVRRADEVERDRYGEIVFRLYFGLLYRDRIALGDPHPGNYLLCPDGRVCFLDFGLLRSVDAARVAAERAIAFAVRDGDAEVLKGALRAGGYLPASRADAVDADFALTLMRMAIKWYAVPGERRFSPVDRRDRDRERPDPEERAAMRMQVNQFALPPEAILIRRMHGIVAVVLGQLRAGADWGAIAAEYLHGEPPATPLGQAEAEFLAQSGRTARARP